MQAKVEIITPAYAKQLLDQNPSNRKLSETTINRYAADMKAGAWTNNGQGIVITPDGALLDGQHRMHAVLRSQREIAMLVVRGVPPEAFVTMDSGKARSFADVLSVQGCVHVNTLASLSRLSFNYAAGANLRYTPTKTTLHEFVQQHPYAQDVAKLMGNAKLKMPRSPLGAVLLLGNHRRNLDDEVVEFIDGLESGAGLFKGDARLALREWVNQQKLRERGQLTSQTLFAATARAWNAFASGKELSVLRALDAPTRVNLPIFGFNREDFADVPDIAERRQEVRRSNLSKGRATPALRLATSAAALVA